MDRLEAEFGADIDFIHLDIDQSLADAVRLRFDLTDRSHYVLIDAQGAVLYRWYGFLNRDSVAATFAELLPGVTAPVSAIG